MKKLPLILIALFIGCLDTFDPTVEEEKEQPKPTGTITITKTSQTYYSTLRNYGSLEVFYDIKNTGNVEISYYKVYFNVTLSDGSTVMDWDNGLSVPVNGKLSDNTYINTKNLKAVSISLSSVEYQSY